MKNTNVEKLTLAQLVSNQVQTRKSSNYINYTSKKAFLNHNNLTGLSNYKEISTLITELKNVFQLHTHINTQYLIITLYFGATKTYQYIVVNTSDLTVTPVGSIKTAKEQIQEFLK